MNILIFDDNIYDIQQLKTNIDSFFQTLDMPYHIDNCTDEQYLYEHINNYDILFLDIEINHLNGIEIGMKLNQYKHNCCIIITTNFKKYAIDGYKINASRYFTKPINQNEFNIEMKSVINHYLIRYSGFYDPKIATVKILYDDIICIEYFNRKTTLYLQNSKKIKTPYNLKHWLNLLRPYTFSQPYKSFFINLNYIDEIKKDEIIMTNKKIIPLSRHYRKNFLNQYLKHLTYHV